VQWIEVVLAGASGGIDSLAGRGGVVHATIPVTGGSILYIFVGGVGKNPKGGWNGGGDGFHLESWNKGYGGGGASDIRITGMTLLNRMVVAGGGGGYYSLQREDMMVKKEQSPSSGCGGGSGESGGTQLFGGAAGANIGGLSIGATNGTLGIGGHGGHNNACGGGGGYYGGKKINKTFCVFLLNNFYRRRWRRWISRWWRIILLSFNCHQLQFYYRFQHRIRISFGNFC
jgi:hypothetical protein